MKIKVTEQELNECITNVVKRVLSEDKDRRSVVDTNVNPIYPNEKKNKPSNWPESPEFVDYVTIKTDIDPVETSILDEIRNNFTDVELEIDTDVVTGKKNFNVTKDKKLIRRLIDLLKKHDVNIIE
jgi:hypothetical protein